MEDRELADAVVALGVADYMGNPVEMSRPGYTELGRSYWLGNDDDNPQRAELFVRDFRVAGALMEKVTLKDLHRVIRAATTKLLASRTVLNVSDSLPRAIIEACVAALTQEGSK